MPDTGIPVHQHTGTPSYQAPLHRYTNTPIRRYTSTPAHRAIELARGHDPQCSNTTMYTGTPIHKYTDTPVHQYTGTPVHQYGNTPVPSARARNAHTCAHTHAQLRMQNGARMGYIGTPVCKYAMYTGMPVHRHKSTQGTPVHQMSTREFKTDATVSIPLFK